MSECVYYNYVKYQFINSINIYEKQIWPQIDVIIHRYWQLGV